MIYLTLTLRLFHILFMGTWSGAALFAAGDIKRTLNEPKAFTPLLIDRMNRYARLAFVSALGTLGTGFAMIFTMGGFKAVGSGVHFGIITGILMFVVGVGGLGRTSTAIAQGITDGKSVDELMPMVKRMGMATGMFHLLWLITLILMVFRNAL